MNLSPIARGVNALCHQLASAQPPAPVSILNVDYTQALIDQHWPIPKPAPSRWVSRDEAAAMFDPARDLTGEVGTFGFDWGKGDDMAGWWAKIGGNPPTFWPYTIEQKDLEEVFGHAQAMEGRAVRTWFDEQELRIRAERVDIRKDARTILEGIDAAIEGLALGKIPAGTTTASTAAPAPDLDLVKHCLHLAGIMRSLPAAEPAQPVRMTRSEYIRFTAQCDVYRASGRRFGLSTLAGLPIEIIPGT